jgi:chain length determinant protein tyrosine kinase EpsG
MHAPLPPRHSPEDSAGSAGSVAQERAADDTALGNPGDDPAVDTRIGQLLQHAGKLTAGSVERVVGTQQELGLRFGDAALRLGLINQDDIDTAIARLFAYPCAARGNSMLSDRLLAAFHPASPQGDTLRAIRSQLLLRWFGSGQHALAVTGVNAGEASSVFAANLALVFAQLGHRTLLVDANLRHGVQQGLFGLHLQRNPRPAALPGTAWHGAARPGLSDILAGRAGLDVIAPVPGFGTLSVLVSGTVPPNPQELLERASFGALHAQLGERFDAVLYDVAPTGHGADALAVAAHAGAALLVAHKDRTPLAGLKRLAHQMTGAGLAVIGSVLVED